MPRPKKDANGQVAVAAPKVYCVISKQKDEKGVEHWLTPVFHNTIDAATDDIAQRVDEGDTEVTLTEVKPFRIERKLVFGR